MDRFYLENQDLHRKLVGGFNTSVPAPHFSRHASDTRHNEETTKQYSEDFMVVARVRPMLDGDLQAGFPCAAYPRTPGVDVNKRGQTIDLHDLHNHPRGRPVLKSTKHELDEIFGGAAMTEEIYDRHLDSIVSTIPDGGAGTIFAYGQTGSGKTFTINQLQKLAILALFDGCSKLQKEVHMTMIDLAGNSASDLLNSRKPIALLDDAEGITHFAGATEHRLESKEHVLDLLQRATTMRSTASTVKNDASSRSHAVCRLRVKDPATPELEGQLYLVDLAGSEAARDIATHGAERMRETREINMSLSVLKDCIRGKVESERQQAAAPGSRQKKIHIPIRHSTLTRVLRSVFDPQSRRQTKTVVVACINPSLADVMPSKNTLRYAEMLRVPVAAP